LHGGFLSAGADVGDGPRQNRLNLLKQAPCRGISQSNSCV
jgi:hypothetical protein